MTKNKQIISKFLAVGIIVGSLSGCGGSDDQTDISDDAGTVELVTVEPVNVVAVISGDITGDVVEDLIFNTTGTLSVVDPDTDEAAFVAQTNVQSEYGTLTIDTIGAWVYELNNDLANIQALNVNETLTDTLTVTTVDSTSQTITITITGVDEVVVPPPSTTSNGYSQAEGGNYIDGYTDAVPVVNCDEVYDSVSALTSAASNSLTAGTTLCLADGTYDNDFEIEFGGTGTAIEKITIAAENPGKAIITDGEVNILMSGEHVVLQGFVFKNGAVDYNIIKTFGNSVPCNYCRITENTIVDMDDGVNSTDDSKKWIEIYGAYTRFDHNWVSGKTSRGALLIVDRFSDEWSDSIAASFEVDYAQIDYNYIGDRPPIEGKAYADSSDNEYEGIRIGLSTSHSGDSFSVVENNYFERIQGEAEVISNKATNNTIRNNTIRDSYGSIVTRHGNTATISNNFIIGDDNPFSGGIRLVDDSHSVTNNYIEGARYLDSNWNGGIVLTTGDGSGDGENGYQDVSNVLVAHNTIVDSVNSLNVYGGKESTEPDSVYFVNNIIADAIGAVIKNAGDMPTNSLYAGNYVEGIVLSDDDEDTTIDGMTMLNAKLDADDKGIYRPSDDSPALTAESNLAIDNYTLPTIDMDGQTRSDVTVSGADEVLTSDEVIAILTSADVGPMTYTATPGEVHVAMVELANHDFDSKDFTGWTNNGAEIETDAEEVFSRGASLKLDSNDSNITQTVSIIANTNYTVSSFVKGIGKLSVLVDGVTYYAEQDSSSYKFTSATFNSGSATSAVITAAVDDFVVNEVVSDSDLVEFKAGDGEWETIEGTNAGDVGGSSNSASGADGSAKLGYNKPSHSNTSPTLFQTVYVDKNTSYDFSFAMLVKNNSTSSVTVRIEGDKGIILNDTVVTVDELTDVDLDDSFERFTSTSINSGENESVTISIIYNAHTIVGDLTVGGDGKLSSSVQKKNELRIDDVSFVSQGAPADGTEAYFDSFRLVSHAEAPNGYAATQGD